MKIHECEKALNEQRLGDKNIGKRSLGTCVIAGVWVFIDTGGPVYALCTTWHNNLDETIGHT